MRRPPRSPLFPYAALCRSNTGGVWSTTLMTWLAVLALPQASVAVPVRGIVDRPAQQPGPGTSANGRWGCASQASFTEGVAELGAARHSTLLGAGGAPDTRG